MNENQLNSSKSLYIQIKDLIKEKILSGEYMPGSKLPSENELCKTFNVSRITIRNAFSEAIKEGLIFTVQGKGTFVREEKDMKISQTLIHVNSFENTIKSQGMEAGTTILNYEIHTADTEIVKILNLNADNKVFQLNLLGTANNQPFVLYQSHFQVDIGELMYKYACAKQERGDAFSTLDLYNNFNFINPTYVEQTFEAIAADTLTSSILKVKKGFPLFLITSTLYSKDNTPLEYKKALYRSDKYKFYISRNLV